MSGALLAMKSKKADARRSYSIQLLHWQDVSGIIPAGIAIWVT
jgi:hypothetical protein